MVSGEIPCVLLYSQVLSPLNSEVDSFLLYHGNSRFEWGALWSRQYTIPLCFACPFMKSSFPLFSKTVTLVNKVAIIKKVVQSQSLVLSSKNCKRILKTLSKVGLHELKTLTKILKALCVVQSQ